jgi:hypothetical protein
MAHAATSCDSPLPLLAGAGISLFGVLVLVPAVPLPAELLSVPLVSVAGTSRSLPVATP